MFKHRVAKKKIEEDVGHVNWEINKNKQLFIDEHWEGMPSGKGFGGKEEPESANEKGKG